MKATGTAPSCFAGCFASIFGACASPRSTFDSAIAVIGAEMAGSLNPLISAQFLAGAAWGCMLMSAFSAALAIGEAGAEGKVVGLVFSALALATFARMAAVAGGLQKLPEYAPLLHWVPVACWSVAGAGLLVLAAGRARQGVHPVSSS